MVIFGACCGFYSGLDAAGRHHAACYIVRDASTSYYLMGGVDKDLRQSNAASACLWHAIKEAGTRSKVFDFAGSMIESLAHFFRGFGGVQMLYFHVSKDYSRLLKLWRVMKF